MSDSSVESKQSRKVRGRGGWGWGDALVSVSLLACRFHQRVHLSVTQHASPEKTPAVFILKSHVRLWSISPCQEKAILIHSCSIWPLCLCWFHHSLQPFSCSSFVCGFPVSITMKNIINWSAWQAKAPFSFANLYKSRNPILIHWLQMYCK